METSVMEWDLYGEHGPDNVKLSWDMWEKK